MGHPSFPLFAGKPTGKGNKKAVHVQGMHDEPHRRGLRVTERLGHGRRHFLKDIYAVLLAPEDPHHVDLESLATETTKLRTRGGPCHFGVPNRRPLNVNRGRDRLRHSDSSMVASEPPLIRLPFYSQLAALAWVGSPVSVPI